MPTDSSYPRGKRMKGSTLGVTRSKVKAEDRFGGLAEASFSTIFRQGTWYIDLYSALDDKHLVLKALRHGSHSLTFKQHHACL